MLLDLGGILMCAPSWKSRLASLVIAWNLMGFHCFAQDLQKPKLQIEKETPLTELAPEPTLEPIKCDSRGNFYLRFYRPQPFASPIVKITSEGQVKATFAIQKVAGWEQGEFTDFEIGLDGQVYLLAVRLGKNKMLEHGIVVFDEEANFRYAINLKPPFRLDSLDHFGVFRTGEFLLLGYRELGSPTANANEPISGRASKDVEPIALTVDRNGNLITEVSFRPAPDPSRPRAIPSTRLYPMAAIHGASLTMHEDGNIYLLLRSKPPLLHVISPNLHEPRTLKLTPPSEAAEAIDVTTAPGAGLVVEFAEMGQGLAYPAEKMTFSLINTLTGERISDFQSNQRLGGALTCYDRGAFYLLGSSKGSLAILKAIPK